MSERYARLFSLTENLYAEGSPVILAAGALLKDTQTGKILAQLKLRNIAPKRIKAASVRIQPLDVIGKPIEETVEYQYLDLDTARDGYFGAKSAISLPTAARAFTVGVENVVFEDNSVWTADGAAWEQLQAPRWLASLYSTEVVEQFQIEYGKNTRNEFLEQKGLWTCVCGVDNRADEERCHRCSNTLEGLRGIDAVQLKANAAARLKKERQEAAAHLEKKRQEAAAEAERARKQAKKNRKIALIATCAVAVCVAVGILLHSVIIPYIKYNSAYHDAMSLMDVGKYEEAIAAFEALDGYKDSVAKIVQCYTGISDREYNDALALMDAGKYEEAITAFEALDGYKDSNAKIKECHEKEYNNALALMENGQYEEAIAAFEAMDGYKDSNELITECNYHIAEEMLSSGDVAHAAMLFGSIDYKDSKARSTELWDEIVPGMIAAGAQHTVGLKSDGTVFAAGDNDDGQCNVSGWSDIVAISAGISHTVGLKSDGTVVAVGWNEYGQCGVSGWSDIVAISAGCWHTVGLKSDGTVIATGNNDDGQCDVSGWSDIVAISAGSWHTVGLKSDGTVIAAGWNEYGQCDVSEWSDIVAISAGRWDTVGLKSDGTVVAVGYNDNGQCDVSSWSNIVAISAGSSHTVGLKSDGTVVAVGYNKSGQCNVSDWSDIVAISAGTSYTVGLKSDGTVVAVGDNGRGQCNVSGWTDIVAISANDVHTVGLKSDGTVVAVGSYDADYGQCDVSDWKDIKLP